MNKPTIRIGFNPCHSWFPAKKTTVNDSNFGFQAGNVQSTLDLLANSYISINAANSLLTTQLNNFVLDYNNFKDNTNERLGLLEDKTAILDSTTAGIQGDLANNYSALNGYIGTVNSYMQTQFDIVDTHLESSVSQITSLHAELNNNVATLDSKIASSVTATEALSLKTDTLTSEFNGNKGSVESQLSTLTTNYESLSQSTIGLRSEFDNNKSSVNSTLTSLSNDVSSQASSILELNTQYSGIVNSMATYNDTVTALSDANQSLVSHVDTLKTTYENGLNNVEATLTQTNTVISDNTQAIATNKTELQSNIDNVQSELDITNQTVATNTQAISTNRTELQSNIDNVSSQLTITNQTVATNTQAISSTKTELQASIDGVDAKLTSTDAVVAGMFKPYVEGDTPQIGNIKLIGDTVYQYLGGTLGENNDGWVRTDLSAQQYADTLKAQIDSDIQAINNDLGGLNTEVSQQAISISNLDGKISTEEQARIEAILAEQQARADDITARVQKDAELDGKITAEEQARIEAANALDVAYRNYSRVVTKAIADGVLTDEEKALIADAQAEVDLAKARFLSLENSVASINNDIASISTDVSQQAIDISNLDGRITTEEQARINDINAEQQARLDAIQERINEDALLDGKITSEEQARINAINVLDNAYRNYNRVVTKAISDGVLTDEEKALIADAQNEVDLAKQRFLNLENSVTDLSNDVASINTAVSQQAITISNLDEKITTEEQSRINDINAEQQARINAIQDRINEDALLDGKITAEEQARINAINNIDNAYKNYSKVVTKAIADGVLTDEEKALIADAQTEVDLAKQRFLNLENGITSLNNDVASINTDLSQHAVDISNLDGRITTEEQERINAITNEQQARINAIQDRINQDALLDGKITAEEQARINAINNLDSAYKNYNKIITKAISDGVLTDEELALISDAQNEVDLAKQRFLDIENSVDNINQEISQINTDISQQAIDISNLDGKITDEEQARIVAIGYEQQARVDAIQQRINEDALLDGKISDEEQARIDAIDALDAAYKEYNRVVTKAISDGVLTDEELALIADAENEVNLAKQRFLDIENSVTSIIDGTIPINLDSAVVSGKNISDYVTGEIDKEVVVYSGNDHTLQTGMKVDDIYIETKVDNSGALPVDVVNIYTYDGNSWFQENNNDNIIALADKTDGKRTIYSGHVVPTGAQENDLWIPDADTENYNAKELYQYISGSWVATTKYTDDTALNNFINNIYIPNKEELQSQLDRKIETFYQTTDPKTDWTTENERKNHHNDIWADISDTTNIIAYRYNSTINSWYLAADLNDLLTKTYNAQETADSKRVNYYGTQSEMDAKASSELDKGDTWTLVNGSTFIWDGSAWIALKTEEGSEAHGWAAGASKLITDPNSGAVTGWQFADGSNVQSQFKVNTDKFIIENSNGTIQPFVIDANGIHLNSNVDINGSLTIHSFDDSQYDSLKNANTTWSLIKDDGGKPANNADVTNYDSPLIANNYSENGITTIPKPAGATYHGNGTKTGAIVITLPQSWTNTMMLFDLNVYNYSLNTSFKLLIGGYTYSGESSWYNNSAQLFGGTTSNNRVRFGHNGSKCVVVIGNTDSNWYYPAISVRNLQASHSNNTIDQWKSNWHITITNSLSGITFSGSDFSDTRLDTASVKGLGLLAVKDKVNLASSEVINKSLANVDSAANNKLNGIENNANVTGNHTSADTAKVAGTSASTVKNNAQTGYNLTQNNSTQIHPSSVGESSLNNIKNSTVTLASDGTLNGAGGGKVTVSGIGAETPSGAQSKANAARDTARDNLAVKLGYPGYTELAAAASLNGELTAAGGYLNASLIQTEALISKFVGTNQLTADNIDVSDLKANFVGTNKLTADNIDVDTIYLNGKLLVPVVNDIGYAKKDIIKRATPTMIASGGGFRSWALYLRIGSSNKQTEDKFADMNNNIIEVSNTFATGKISLSGNSAKIRVRVHFYRDGDDPNNDGYDMDFWFFGNGSGTFNGENVKELMFYRFSWLTKISVKLFSYGPITFFYVSALNPFRLENDYDGNHMYLGVHISVYKSDDTLDENSSITPDTIPITYEVHN